MADIGSLATSGALQSSVSALRGPRTGDANPLLSPGAGWRPPLLLYLADSHPPSSAGSGCGVRCIDNSQHLCHAVFLGVTITLTASG